MCGGFEAFDYRDIFWRLRSEFDRTDVRVRYGMRADNLFLAFLAPLPLLSCGNKVNDHQYYVFRNQPRRAGTYVTILATKVALERHLEWLFKSYRQLGFEQPILKRI